MEWVLRITQKNIFFKGYGKDIPETISNLADH